MTDYLYCPPPIRTKVKLPANWNAREIRQENTEAYASNVVHLHPDSERSHLQAVLTASERRVERFKQTIAVYQQMEEDEREYAKRVAEQLRALK